jgi:hypothetical protein
MFTQVYAVSTSGVPVPTCNARKAWIATKNAAIGSPHPTTETNRFSNRLPLTWAARSPFSENPASGNRTMRVSGWFNAYPLRSAYAARSSVR